MQVSAMHSDSTTSFLVDVSTLLRSWCSSPSRQNLIDNVVEGSLLNQQIFLQRLQAQSVRNQEQSETVPCAEGKTMQEQKLKQLREVLFGSYEACIAAFRRSSKKESLKTTSTISLPHHQIQNQSWRYT